MDEKHVDIVLSLIAKGVVRGMQDQGCTTWNLAPETSPEKFFSKALKVSVSFLYIHSSPGLPSKRAEGHAEVVITSKLPMDVAEGVGYAAALDARNKAEAAAVAALAACNEAEAATDTDAAGAEANVEG